MTGKSEKIPDTHKFIVKWAELPGFLHQLHNKLTFNADRFLNEHSKVCYAASHLEGDAREVTMAHTNDAKEIPIASTLRLHRDPQALLS